MERVKEVAFATGNFILGIIAYTLGVIVGLFSVAVACVQVAASLVTADVVTIIFGALYTWPLWNYVLTTVFPVPGINFLQALGLVTLAHILFRAKAYVTPRKTAEERLLDDLIKAANRRTSCDDPQRGCATGPKRPMSGASR